MTTPRTTSRHRLLSLASAAVILGGCAVDLEDDERRASFAVDERVAPGEVDQRPPPTAVVGDPVSATPITVQSYGEVCIYANDAPLFPFNPGPTKVEAGDSVVFQVSLPECLSESCDVDRKAQCKVSRQGNQIVVDAAFSWVSLDMGTCTFDCGQLIATCATEPLPEGDYEIVFADAVASLPVPSVGEACPISVEPPEDARP